MLKTSEVNIRDPYVLAYGSKYYMYGTRSATTWGLADGFDCYISENLEDWEGPVEIFKRPEGFFQTANTGHQSVFIIRTHFIWLQPLGLRIEKKASIY